MILQNFVYSHSDCTKEKLEHWSEYIQKTWREPGRAQCCFEDMCNNESLFQDTGPIIDDSVSIEAGVVDTKITLIDTKKIDCTQCLEIPHAFCMAEPDQDPNNIRMDFDEKLMPESYQVYFTSEVNSYGAIDLSWVDGKEFTIEVDPNYHLEYDVNLQTYTYKSLQLTSNCSSEDAYYKCISNL